MIHDELKAQPVVAALLERFSDAVIESTQGQGEFSLFIDLAQIVPVMQFLRDEQQFNRLSGITGVDWYPIEPRFEVVYLLHSLNRNQRLRLKCRAGESTEIDSITSVYAGANWYEREVWDLFGIRFRNHPNLVRIMMPEEWTEHPLRRDFPTHGHRYDYSSE